MSYVVTTVASCVIIALAIIESRFLRRLASHCQLGIHRSEDVHLLASAVRWDRLAVRIGTSVIIVWAIVLFYLVSSRSIVPFEFLYNSILFVGSLFLSAGMMQRAKKKLKGASIEVNDTELRKEFARLVGSSVRVDESTGTGKQ